MPRYTYIAVYDLGDGSAPVPEIQFAHCEVHAPTEQLAYEAGRAKLSEEEDDEGLMLGELVIEVKA